MVVMTTKADGAMIRRLREAQGIGCTQLAEAAGIDMRLLSKIETGRLDGSPKTRLKIARALGVDLSQITYEVPSKRVSNQAA
jgi:transcriptional regulator with XRE-family HTH domain